MHPDGERVDVTVSIVKFKIDNNRRYLPQLSIVSVTKKGDKINESSNKENPGRLSSDNSSVNPHSVGCFVRIGLVLVLVSYISEKQLILFKCNCYIIPRH